MARRTCREQTQTTQGRPRGESQRQWRGQLVGWQAAKRGEGAAGEQQLAPPQVQQQAQQLAQNSRRAGVAVLQAAPLLRHKHARAHVRE